MPQVPEGSSPLSPGLRAAAGLGCALVLLLCALVVTRQWRGESLLAAGRGKAAFREGRTVELLRKSLDHGNAEAAVELARRAYERREWEAVRTYVDRALALNAYQGYAYVLKAYALAAGKMPATPSEADMILDECRSAVRIEPAGGGLWRSCAELSLRIYLHLFPEGGPAGRESKYRKEALGFYRRALAFPLGEERPFIAAMADQGPDALFMVQALPDATLAAVRETVALLIDRDAWWAVRPAYWKMAGAAANPRTPYRAAAEALRSRKRYREAFTALEAYNFTEKDDAYLAYLAALSAEALGGEHELWAEAERLYLTAVRLDGKRRDYRRRLGLHLFRKKALDDAEPHFLAIAAGNPGDHEARYYLGRIAEARGEAAKALNFYREALSLSPENGRYRKLVEQGEAKE